MLDKKGRPRHYDTTPTPGYADAAIAFMAAYLRELRARVVDQIEDLPTVALDFASPEIRFTIGQLALHLCWAEVRRLSSFLHTEVDDEIETVMSQGSLSRLGSTLPPSRSAEELTEIIGTSESIVDELLRSELEPDRARVLEGSTLRGVLMHLQWHWSFHSGHIGLIRLLWGSDYIWTIHQPLAPHP